MTLEFSWKTGQKRFLATKKDSAAFFQVVRFCNVFDAQNGQNWCASFNCTAGRSQNLRKNGNCYESSVKKDSETAERTICWKTPVKTADFLLLLARRVVQLKPKPNRKHLRVEEWKRIWHKPTPKRQREGWTGMEMEDHKERAVTNSPKTDSVEATEKQKQRNVLQNKFGTLTQSFWEQNKEDTRKNNKKLPKHNKKQTETKTRWVFLFMRCVMKVVVKNTKTIMETKESRTNVKWKKSNKVCW